MNYAKVNQFLFTIETKAKIKGAQGGYYLGNFSSKEIFTVNPDRECHLKWSLLNDPRTMHYHENDLQMVPPKGAVPKYIGDDKFTSPAPDIRLDFCDNTRDTAHFFAFKKTGDVEMWQLPNIQVPSGVSLATYLIAFPDNKRFSDYQKGQVSTNYTAPFGFYVKQVPWNNRKVIVEKTIYSKDVTQYPQYVEYGEFKLKIEQVETPRSP